MTDLRRDWLVLASAGKLSSSTNHTDDLRDEKHPCYRTTQCNIKTFHQWRRSDVKYGGQGQSGQAIVSESQNDELFQRGSTSIISKHSTIPVPDSLYCRRLEKLILPSIFDMSFFVKLAELFTNSFELEACIVDERQFKTAKRPQAPIMRHCSEVSK